MSFQFPPINYLYLVATVLAVTLALSHRGHADSPGGRLWVGVLWFFALWTSGELIANTGTTLAWQLAFQRSVYIGASGAVVCWLLFALSYSGFRQWLTARNVAVLLVVPVCSAIMVLTLEWHDLLYSQARLVERNGYQVLDLEHGAGYWLLVLGFAYPYTITGCVLLLWVSVKRPGVYRWQGTLIAIAALIPLVSDILFLSGLDLAGGFDPTSLYFMLSAVLITLATGRYHFLALTPVARDQVFETINLPVVVCNREGRITDSNPAFSRLFGVSGHELVGRPLREILVSRFTDSRLGVGDGLLHGRLVDEPDGRQFDVHSTPVSGNRSESPGFLVTLQDVTGVQEALDRITRVAPVESPVQASPGQGVVVVADIDHFRRINDEHGKEFGDTLLAELNRLIRESIRPADQIIRWDGEEFCIVLQDTPLSAGRTAMERLRRTVEQHSFGDTDNARITVTFGLVARSAEETLDDAIRRADLLMYVGKQDGRNRVVAGE